MEVDHTEQQHLEAEFDSVAELTEESTSGASAIVDASSVLPTPVKRGRGRPKKSESQGQASAAKTTTAIAVVEMKPDPGAEPSAMDVSTTYDPSQAPAVTPKRRGRPPGTPNKPKTPGEKPTPIKRGKVGLRTNQWEVPFAPKRMGRPVTRLQQKWDFSIGTHVHDLVDSLRAEDTRVVAQSEHVPFPQWLPTLDSITLWDDETAISFMPGRAQSLPISLTECPIDVSNFKPFRIERFAAERKDLRGDDYFLNAGGPINDLAWCPQPFGISPQRISPEFMHSFLAITTFTDAARQHPVGEFETDKRNIIQIWDMGQLHNTGSTDQSFVPFMSLAITHEMDYIQQILWCPLATPQPLDDSDLDILEDQIPRLGLLAAVLADGAVCIFPIPNPHALHLHYNGDKYSRKPLFIDLKPCLTLVTPDRSVITCIAWSHLNGGSSLAAATLDGKLAVWSLPLDGSPRTGIASPNQTSFDDPPISHSLLSPTTGASSETSTQGLSSNMFSLGELDPLGLYETLPPSLPLYWNDPVHIPTFFRKTHSFPTRALRWHTVDPDIIAIGTAQAPLLLWNIKNPAVSLSTTQLLGGVCSDIAFTCADTNYALVVSTDDGSTRMVAPPTYRVFDIHKDPCTSLDFSPLLRLQVSAGLDGLVFLTAVIEGKKSALWTRKMPPGVFIDKVELSSHGSVLKFSYSSTECANTLSPSTPDTVEKAKKAGSAKKKDSDEPKVERGFKDSTTFITKIRWSTNLRTPSWLAYGTRSGIARVSSITWTNTPLH